MIAPDLDTAIYMLRDLIEDAQAIVPFTGAGISTECGIPDFRSPGGIWTKNQPIPFDEFMASPEMRDESWRRRFIMEDKFGGARPGRGHRALASLYRAGKVPGLITQNIDNLHQVSGIAAADVVELHGNTTYALCLDCGERYELAWVREKFEAAGEHAPDCACGGYIKTGTISFGQAMPVEAMERAEQLTRSSDLFLSIGSSLVVWPAAGFPVMAKRKGARLVIINREPTELDDIADLVVRHDIGDVLSPFIATDSLLLRCVQSCAQAHFTLCRLTAGVIFDSAERFVEAPGKRRPTKRRRASVMASDGIESKMSGTNLRPGAARELVDETTANLIEMAGVIKWFDVSKGFGFIVPDNGMPDVLLHVTCLRRDGYQTAYEGARVVCEVLPRAKGLQAFRILSMDESTAVHPAQMPPPRTHVTVTPTSGLERAQVKWFNRLRGFGFLTRGEGTPDIFVHMETLRRYGIAELRPGQTVLVRFGPGPKGLMAAEVRPDGGPLGLASH